jgi:hypothetical protein
MERRGVECGARAAFCSWGGSMEKKRVSHPVLRPNRMLIVYVPRNQVFTHTIQKIDTE